MNTSRCGILCEACPRRKQTGCHGCTNMAQPFWGGSCGVKSCCEAKGLAHCGLFPGFPCKMLAEMGVEQGFDPAPRLRQCIQWQKDVTKQKEPSV